MIDTFELKTLGRSHQKIIGTPRTSPVSGCLEMFAIGSNLINRSFKLADATTLRITGAGALLRTKARCDTLECADGLTSGFADAIGAGLGLRVRRGLALTTGAASLRPSITIFPFSINTEIHAVAVQSWARASEMGTTLTRVRVKIIAVGMAKVREYLVRMRQGKSFPLCQS